MFRRLLHTSWTFLWAVLAVCPLVSILALGAQAQSATPTVRIVSPIDERQLVTLRDSLNPAAIGASDRGSVSADLPMVLTLVLSRSAEEQAAFDGFVASQYDQNSPNFHQWLTPQQIGQRFGPAQADISAISSWLGGHGFAVKSVGLDGMTIQFRGTAGQVENAFHIEIHNLSVKGQGHIANITDPQIPGALAPVVVGIKGLRNFLPHPLHRMGSKVQFNPAVHGWVKRQNSSGTGFTPGVLRPQAPTASTNSRSTAKPSFYYPLSRPTVVEEDVAPYDFAKIYNLPSTWPSTINGTGQIITIIGTSDIELSDVSSFKSAFGLPAGTAPVIAHGPDGDPGICLGGTNACNGGDLDENSLDVEWSGAVAPGAQIVLVTDAYNSQATNDPVFDGAQWAVDNAYVQGSQVYGSRILSLSYGTCELFNGTASNVAYNNLWQTAASGGIAVFVAAGDSGSPSCDQGGDGIGNPYEAQFGLSVSALASSPYDTAVGGTDFSWCNPTSSSNGQTVNGCSSSNASTYWNTSNSSQQASAKGYVPETPWNDTCENPINAAFLESIAPLVASLTGAPTPTNAEGACNFAYEYSLPLDFSDGDDGLMGYVDTVGGSGGASSCVVNTTTSTTLGSCTSTDTSTGASYGNLPLVSDGWPKPSWQTAAASLGVPADGVRDLPDVSSFAGDGTLGSASLICVSNDGATCTDISETGSGETGGAEEVGGTSVASPAMAGVMALINQNAGTPQGSPNAELYALAAKQTYANCSAETGSTSNGCYFNDINQGTNSMPCASTDRVVEGGATYDPYTGGWEEAPQTYALASPNCSIVNSGDTVGTLSGYSAVAGYDQTTGLGSLNIANVISNWTAATAGTKAATVAISLGGVTSITASQSLPVTVTVTGSSGTPTGDITLSASANGYVSSQALSTGTATFTIPANTFTSNGTVTLTAAYSGDGTYASNSGTASFTVTGVTTPTETFALASLPPASVAAGATASVTATVSSSSGYAGTVSLSCSLTGEPSGAVNLPTCSPTGTITLNAAARTGTATLSVTTVASTIESTSLTPASRKGLLGAGGAVLALLVFFGIPARRRSWRTMVGMVALLVTLGSMAACGGSSTTTTTLPGTTAGTYTFTVTPSGSPAPSSTPSSQTFTVTVAGA